MFGWQYPGCVVWRSPLIWRYITVFNDGKYASLDLVERIGHIQKKIIVRSSRTLLFPLHDSDIAREDRVGE
jgi:hypothetical protein